jgi:hypothetical protein
LARSNIKEALTFGWKKLTIVVRIPSAATRQRPRDVSFMHNTKKDDGIVLQVVGINQKVWSNPRHASARTKRRPRRAAARKLNKASQGKIKAAAVVGGNARTGLIGQMSSRSVSASAATTKRVMRDAEH